MFGTAIRSQRLERQFSQEELADRAGLHRTYVSDVERGARNLSLESIERLARALEVSVSALFARAGNGSGPEHLVEILLVEDNAQDAELTRRAFRKAGLTNVLHVARDGAKALDFLFATGAQSHRNHEPLPGVILLDLNLPKIHGLEVLRRIKADRRTREIPVIVLTASDQDRDITACRRLGVANYLVKPVDFSNFSEITPGLEFGWALVKPK
jgi:CheY-like chemotaxis protein/DNA-binding Xre family transcriptional regulator